MESGSRELGVGSHAPHNNGLHLTASQQASCLDQHTRQVKPGVGRLGARVWSRNEPYEEGRSVR